METLTNSFSLSAWTSGGNFYGDPYTVSVQAQLTLRLGPLHAHLNVVCCIGETDEKLQCSVAAGGKILGKGKVG